MKTRGMMSIVMVITLSICGCGRNSVLSSGAQPSGLVTANQINMPGVRMVIYQVAGYGHLPMSALQPLRGAPRAVTSQGDIRSIVDALNQPTGKAFTRMARNNRLAIVGQNGQVIMYGIGGYTIQGCDITAQESSSKLMPALRAAITRAGVTKLTLATPIRSVSYHTAGAVKPVSPGHAALKELLGQYSPLALKGNRRCKAGDIRQLTQRSARFLTVELGRPDAFETVVVDKDVEWPPSIYAANAHLERVSFDTITILSEGNGLVRFAFSDSRSNECLSSDPVRSLRLEREAQGRNPPVYGPDLFDEVVSHIKKP